MAKGKSKHVMFRAEPDMCEALEAVATFLNVSVSEVVRTAVVAGIPAVLEQAERASRYVSQLKQLRPRQDG